MHTFVPSAKLSYTRSFSAGKIYYEFHKFCCLLANIVSNNAMAGESELPRSELRSYAHICVETTFERVLPDADVDKSRKQAVLSKLY